MDDLKKQARRADRKKTAGQILNKIFPSRARSDKGRAPHPEPHPRSAVNCTSRRGRAPEHKGGDTCGRFLKSKPGELTAKTAGQILNKIFPSRARSDRGTSSHPEPRTGCGRAPRAYRIKREQQARTRAI